MSDYHYVQEGVCLHIISQDKARELGMRFYFTGEACKNGHVAQRYVSCSRCLGCELKEGEKRVKRKEEKIKKHPNYHKREEYSFLHIIPRARAQKMGLKWYFNGNPCSKGHFALRAAHSGECIVCAVERDRTQEAIKRRKEYWEKNKERIGPRNIERNKTERAKRLKRVNEKRRLEKDPEYAAYKRMRQMLSRVLSAIKKEKTDRTHKILGYSPAQFKDHMEGLFLEGMSWEERNFHIDHNYPAIRYYRDGVTDPAVVNALENLHPMWPEHNMDKSDRTLKEWLEEKGEDSEEYRLYGHMLKRK